MIRIWRFQSGWERTQHYTELEPIISQAMMKKTTQEWLDELSQLGIPCGPVNRIDQVAKDPQVLAREMIVEVSHPRIGKAKVINTPVKLSRTPGKVERPAPDLGEHTAKVLQELLKMRKEELETLRQSGVL